MAGDDQALYVGAYTSGDGGDGEGISLFWRDPEDGALRPGGTVAQAVSPSFLAPHPRLPVLYAVNETGEGTVSAFAIEDGGQLRQLGTQPTGGAQPCHLAVAGGGRWLVSANYGSGSVAVHPVGEDGALGERVALVAHEGAGPDPERQEGPHAHMILLDPRDEHRFLVPDLGLDQLLAYTLDPASGVPRHTGTVKLEPGSGPRHLAVHPSGDRLFVVGELDASVSVLVPVTGSDSLQELHRRRATVTPAREGEARIYPSGVRCSADGRFLYVANRGRGCVSVFAVNGEALDPVADVPCGGPWPRDLILVGAHLYVANQEGDRLSTFRIAPLTGIPEHAGDLETPSPACVLPA